MTREQLAALYWRVTGAIGIVGISVAVILVVGGLTGAIK